MAFAEEMDIDEVMADDDLVNDSEMSFELSEQGDDGNDVTSLQPKIPFQERVDAFISLKDEKFLKMETYFFSLLRAPGMSVDDILEGTFDDHEVTLITPQPGPPDVVRWQMRNAKRYHENLETRFKGHTDTLAFKMACLYFGLPVEPLRSGTTSFLLSPDPEPLETKVGSSPNPLNFLEKYRNLNEFVSGERILNLRGGGRPSSQNKTGKAIQELLPGEQDLDYGNFFRDVRSGSDSNRKKYRGPNPAARITLYSWQGQTETTFKYRDFVSKVDKLISNWEKEDLPIWLDLFSISEERLVETFQGFLYHGETGPPDHDAVWDAVTKCFTDGNDEEYACFVHPFTSFEDSHPIQFEPSAKNSVIRITNRDNNDVAYMRVPSNLNWDHKPHQFSKEYTYAMQSLLLPHPPHASVVYDGYPSYQYLDPHNKIWDSVLDLDEDQPALIIFKLEELDESSCPAIIPGVPDQRVLDRTRLNEAKADATLASESLGEIHQAIRSALKKTDLKKECSGFEIWPYGTDFKDLSKLPEHVRISRNINDGKSLESWQRFLNTLPENGPLSFVVRPVYKAYQLLNPGTAERVSLQLNQFDLQTFKATVQNHLYENYDPEDPAQAVILGPVSQHSFQAEFAIRYETTEEDWEWIRRNIIDPELTVSVDEIDNEWLIPASSTWGPRYVAQRHDDNDPIPTETASTSQFVGAYLSKASKAHDSSDSSDLSLSPVPRWPPPPKNPKSPSLKRKDLGKAPPAKSQGTGNSTNIFPSTPKPSGPGKPFTGLFTPPKSNGKSSAGSPFVKKEDNDEKDAKHTALDDIFRNSKNTSAEAERVRKLRSRAFTSVSSIFTNPLKPVLPLYGPPLESVIKTGPSMPGVSIAMLTPTEVLRLQKEVHSLRFQLLDRTRECPYADCDRYFTFSDGEGLDRHVREDHNTLRCFLCDKDQNLLPYYNTDKIKEHFVNEHLDEILKAYGKAPAAKGSGASEAVPRPKKKTFVVPWSYDSQDEGSQSPDDASLADGWADAKPATPQKGVSGPSGVKGQTPLPKGRIPVSQPPKPKGPQPTGGSTSKRPPENKPNFWVERANQLQNSQRQNEPAKPTTPATGKISGSTVGDNLNRSQSKKTPVQQQFPGTQKGNLQPKSPKKEPNLDFQERLRQRLHRAESGKLETPIVKGAEPEETSEEEKKPAPKKVTWGPQTPRKQTTTGTQTTRSQTTQGTQTDSKPVKTGTKPTITKTTDPTTKAEIFTIVNPKPGTFEQNGAWIKDALEKYVADGSTTILDVNKKDAPYKIFTAVNPKPGTFQENDAWIKDTLEKHVAEGGSTFYDLKRDDIPFKVFSAVNPRPGTFQENDAYIRNRLFQYHRLGGQPLYPPPTTALEDRISNLLAAGARSAVAGEEEEEVGAKRKRRADDGHGSGSEIYEYSERSAVSDDPDNLAADAPPSPKRVRKVQIAPPPTPATPARSTRSARIARAIAPLSSPSSTSESE
ncbi:hypothetical protein F4678DRAFT_484910 [Xylaria arbuscula]|nr:hypothetical protein F4678DRAFT_484910 [Xylaria arbuscula]